MAGFVQYRAFALGGFTMPAMCPEEESTNWTSAFGSRPVVLYEERHGVMWSLTDEVGDEFGGGEIALQTGSGSR